MKICICGGGNLGHVVAGFIAAQETHEVVLLTRHPERWSSELRIEAPGGAVYNGRLSGIYSDAGKAVSNAQVILLCLPGYAIRPALLQIRDHLQPSCAVGSVVSSTGFFFDAIEVLPARQPLFGFQRVPFIARVTEYGHRARLTGYKESILMAVEHCPDSEALRSSLEAMLHTPVSLLGSHYEASLSNSNPLLHPSRLFSLWGDWHEGVAYDRVPLFYEEWSEEASRLYLAMDDELQRLLAVLPVRPGSLPTVLDYYESTGVTSLTEKLRSIEAFKGIRAPMRAVAGGYVPDFGSRYFTEDFPYGLAIVSRLGRQHQIAMPTIERVLRWGNAALSGRLCET